MKCPILLFLPLLGACFLAAAQARDVDVNGDVTEAGRRVEPPTPAHPAYYLAVVGGYQERGQARGGERVPYDSDVLPRLGQVLAQQGYLPSKLGPVPVGAAPGGSAIALSPQPSLILVFFWGTMNPIQLGTRSANERQMRALIGGTTDPDIMPGWLEWDDLLQDLQEDHFFVLVGAYDFKAYFDPADPRHKVRLWTTRISVDAPGLWLTDVMPDLVRAGGPWFGRATSKPKHVPLDRPGEVKAGEPEVKGYITPLFK